MSAIDQRLRTCPRWRASGGGGTTTPSPAATSTPPGAPLPGVIGSSSQTKLAFTTPGSYSVIVPMDYTTGDRFDHDPALPQSRYPVLDVVRQLAGARAGSDQARFLAVGARRACNRLAFALDEAIGALNACLETD